MNKMSGTQPTIFVTHLEKEGPFLKVWGQTDKNSSLFVEEFLHSATPQFEQGVGSLQQENIQSGLLVGAKYRDSKYYRARITNVNCIKPNFVEIFFLDYGNKDLVPSVNLRSLNQFPTNFISIPPLANCFVLAEAHCLGGGEWNDTVFETISKELCYREFHFSILLQATQYYLIKLFLGTTELVQHLVGRGLLQPISLPAQQAVMLSMSLQSKQTKLGDTSEINAYKTVTLEPGAQYPVYVSYVNDGPCNFSVQLKTSETVLVELMNKINDMHHKLLEEVPIPGTICLARCQEDGNICRAVVTNEVDNQFKVFYVDFGNYEVVPLDALFQIPFRFVLPKIMAIRFALAGVEKSTVTLEMQCAFKKFVDNRLLHMKVLPTSTRLVIPKCELWDPETKTSALDVVNRAALNAYPEPISLSRGFTQLVKVSYVYSCNRFYVQLINRETELVKLMFELQQACKTNETMEPGMLKIDLPCCAIYPDDNQWYRSQIVDILNDPNNVKVRYIDYGNEEIVSSTQLKSIDGELLTVLRPQAIECCLNGYQNFGEDTERDNLLEELILEKQFTMKVVEMVNKKALVELIDENNYNVASLLLDKIAASKSQVSPMLVQAGNRIEHRKNFVPYQNGGFNSGRTDRRSPRDGGGKNWGDRNKDSWRNDNNRNNDKNSNEQPEKSWRQNNKGFNPNNDRFNRENTSNDRNENNWHNKDNTNNWDTSNNDWNDQPSTQNFIKKDNYGRDNKREFKKRDFKKDGSEISSSGSEKSFHKGPRTSSRNEKSHYNNKKFDKPKSDSFDSWNISSEVSIVDPAPTNSIYTTYNLTGNEFKVTVSWFHNPSHFYCQLVNSQDEFKQMMAEIQTFYKNLKPDEGVVGAPMIGLFTEDNVLYRAQILEVLNNQYKIYYVDFGNVSTVDKVWKIDRKFMKLPAQAICCSLNGIEPANSWPNATDFSKYFDKESFDCRFISQTNDKFFVDLLTNGTNISESLINDGLALANNASQSTIKIEIPLLVGQQFRAILKSVNNLSDIILMLQCGALNCKMHNLDQATETHLDTLKQFLEKFVIVYVDDVINDILEVTLYDNDGTKLCIVDPDPGAYDTVEPLCPLLVLNSLVKGFVSHAKETTIYLQPVEYADTILLFLEEMFEYYDKLEQESSIVPVEGLIYAAKSPDTNWYRARCISFDNENVTVLYLDYGNTEILPFSELRELTPKFIEMCTLCIEININVPAEVYLEQNIEVTVYFGETNWEGIVQGNQFVQEQNIPSENFTEEPKNVEIEAPQTTETTNFPGIQVIISHIDTPNDFYLQLNDSLPSIDKLQENLNEQLKDMPELDTRMAGILCAAPYSADQEWYRAKVLDADDDITTVRFVDYGNTDVIDNKTTEIKTLPPNLLSLEVYATRCSLKIKPIDEDGEWSSHVSERFEELTSSTNTITAKFLDQDEKTNYIELYSNGNNVREILINEKLVLADEKTIDIEPKCYVSHLNSPSEFWIQLENCVDELEWIAESLSNAEQFPELDDLAPGTLCAALYPDDEMWYRARILSNTVAGLELLFIDYGNSCLCNNLRQLPEELVVTAPLAQKCSLQRPEGLSYWTIQAIDKFNDISANGQTIFTVKKISTGETATVELFIDGKDVVSMLLPITEDGFVKDFKGFNEFYIEKNGEKLEPVYKLELLPGVNFDNDSIKRFEELNKNSETLFQIEFLHNEFVRLYQNGRDIRIDLGGTKVSSSFNSSNTSEDPIDNSPSEDSTGDNNTDHSKENKDSFNMANTSGDSGVTESENMKINTSLIDEQKSCDFVKETEDVGESDDYTRQVFEKNEAESCETENVNVSEICEISNKVNNDNTLLVETVDENDSIKNEENTVEETIEDEIEKCATENENVSEISDKISDDNTLLVETVVENDSIKNDENTVEETIKDATENCAIEKENVSEIGGKINYDNTLLVETVDENDSTKNDENTVEETIEDACVKCATENENVSEIGDKISSDKTLLMERVEENSIKSDENTVEETIQDATENCVIKNENVSEIGDKVNDDNSLLVETVEENSIKKDENTVKETIQDATENCVIKNENVSEIGDKSNDDNTLLVETVEENSIKKDENTIEETIQDATENCVIENENVSETGDKIDDDNHSLVESVEENDFIKNNENTIVLVKEAIQSDLDIKSGHEEIALILNEIVDNVLSTTDENIPSNPVSQSEFPLQQE